MKQELINIGGEIKIARTAKKITQKELAQKIGVSHEWICKIERGKAKNITFSLLLAITDILDIKIDLSNLNN